MSRVESKNPRKGPSFGSSVQTWASASLIIGLFLLSNVHPWFATASQSADFSMSASFSGQNFPQGSFVNDNTITLTSSPGFAGTVILTTTVSPLVEDGIFVSLTQTNITLSSGATGYSTLLIYSSSLTPMRNYNVTVIGVSGATWHSITVGVGVTPPTWLRSFTMSVSSKNVSFAQGFRASPTITLQSLNGFAGYVSLIVAVEPLLPVGFGTGFTSPLFLAAGGTANTTLWITSSDRTPPGDYVLVLIGSSGSLSDSSVANFSLLVQVEVKPLLEPDFVIDVTDVNTDQGSSETVRINLLSLKGFQGSANLTASVSPRVESSPMIEIGSNPAYIPAGSAGVSFATVSTSYATPVGVYVLNVTATSGDLSRSASSKIRIFEYRPPSSPGDSQFARLEYRLSYFSRTLYSGGQVTFVNSFSNTGQLVVRVTRLTVRSDFGTVSLAGSLPAVLSPGDVKVLNATVRVSLVAFAGNHTVTASADWQYYHNATGWATPSSSPITVQGMIPIGSGPFSLAQPLVSLLSTVTSLPPSTLAYGLLAISTYFILALIAVLLAIRKERKRRAKYPA